MDGGIFRDPGRDDRQFRFTQIRQGIGGQSHRPERMRLVGRAAGDRHRPDRIVPVGNGLDVEGWLGRRALAEIAAILTVGPFLAIAGDGDMTLNHDLCRGWHVQIDADRFHHRHRLARQGANVIRLVGVGRDRNAGHAGDRRSRALHQRVRHRLAELHPLGPDLADMLARDDQSHHPLAVNLHYAGDRPVHPFAVRRFNNQRAPGVGVATAVLVVGKGEREAIEAGRLATQDILMTQGVRRGHPYRGNAGLMAGRRQSFDDLRPG